MIDLGGYAALAFRPLVDRVFARAEYDWNNATSGPVPALRRLLDTLKTPVLVKVRNHSGSLTVTYAGLRDGLRHGLMFIEEQVEAASGSLLREMKPSTWSEIRTFAGQELDSDLLVIGAPRAWLNQIVGEQDLIAPMRMHYVVKLGRDQAPFRTRVSSDIRRRLAKGERERNWTLDIRTDESAFCVSACNFNPLRLGIGVQF